MVDVHRYHEISETDHAILNPLADRQLEQVGDICGLEAGQRQLDLACGKGEMLCRYAARHGVTGVGVDIHAGCLEAANARALELAVDRTVTFVQGDAATYAPPPNSFDVVSCIGATWIGGGLRGTLDLLRAPLRLDGWILVGDLFWNEEPPPSVREALAGDGEFFDLVGTLACFEDAGLDLVEMVVAGQETWDRYSASQWLNVSRWLAAHPGDPEADEVRANRDRARRDYLQYERRYLGWGVFIARPL